MSVEGKTVWWVTAGTTVLISLTTAAILGFSGFYWGIHDDHNDDIYYTIAANDRSEYNTQMREIDRDIMSNQTRIVDPNTPAAVVIELKRQNKAMELQKDRETRNYEAAHPPAK